MYNNMVKMKRKKRGRERSVELTRFTLNVYTHLDHFVVALFVSHDH